MFKCLHPENLNQLRSLLNHPRVKEVYFHGDGNMYIVKKESDDRQIFHNFNTTGANHPANIGAGYRVRLTSAAEVPDTLDQMEKLLLESRQKEDTVAQETAYRENNFVFEVTKTDTAVVGAPETLATGSLGKTIASVPDPAATGTPAPESKKSVAAGLKEKLDDATK
jgi:hypothetical protein